MRRTKNVPINNGSGSSKSLTYAYLLPAIASELCYTVNVCDYAQPRGRWFVVWLEKFRELLLNQDTIPSPDNADENYRPYIHLG